MFIPLSHTQVFSPRLPPPVSPKPPPAPASRPADTPRTRGRETSTSCIGSPLTRRVPVLYHRKAARAEIPLAEQEGVGASTASRASRAAPLAGGTRRSPPRRPLRVGRGTPRPRGSADARLGCTAGGDL